MRHTLAYRLSNSLSCYASWDARRTQPKQSSTSPWEHARSLCHHLRWLLWPAPPSETTLGSPCFGTEAAFTSVTCKKSPHQRRTQTTQTPCTALYMAQAKLVTSPYRVLPQHSLPHKCQQGTGEEIQVFWHFCLYFLVKLLFARANVSSVAQLANTTPCRERRKKRIPFGKKNNKNLQHKLGLSGDTG